MPPHAMGLESTTTEWTDVDLEVAGTIPGWLSGTLLRNGPALFEVGESSLNHWFDGLAMLRRYSIGDGAVTASTAFLRSEEYEHVRDHGSLATDQFGTTAPTSFAESIRNLVDPTLTDNASVSVDRIGGRYAAITETPRAVGFDPETLETHETFDPDSATDATGTLGHPHADFRREETVNMGVRFGRQSEYVLLRRSWDDAESERVGSFSVDRPAYFHSFALTDRYAILAECPLRLSPLSLLRDRPFIENYGWDSDRPARFLVFDRNSGTVVAAPETAPFFVFHHVNAFETGDEVVVDLVAFEDASVVDALFLDELRSPERTVPGGEYRRYALSLDEEAASSRTLSTGPVEFPMLDYRRVNGRPYRYAYFAGNRESPTVGLPTQLLKVDLERETETVWREDGTYPGEPVFVARDPHDHSTAEDDGAILTIVLDPDSDRSLLVVLDAATFEERARAELPGVVPFGFHGQFYRTFDRYDRTMP
ncbi:carotenoid oxygenase family protein [Haloferacaceae archaeon DSL9]